MHHWLRQEPSVRAWSQAYRNDGLIVIGVHTPEFSFEHEIDLVGRATRDERAIIPSQSTTTTRSGTPSQEPIPFRVLLDGEAPGPSHGADVDEDGNGLLEDGRLYQLVRQHDTVRERTVQITFLDAGAEAYAFTLG